MTGADASASPALRLAVRLALAVLLIGGLARAASLAWVCDDAFISYRYAENWIAGNGLVYNVGERVEGYTNLLWTLAVGVCMRFGADPVRASEALGVLAYGLLAGAMVRWSWRQSRVAGRPFLPLAAGIVLVSDDFHVWATGGLETMAFTLLAFQALVTTRSERFGDLPALLSGVLLALLVLTRPDGLLFAGAGVVSYWVPFGRWPPRDALRRASLTAAPVVLCLAWLVPWKLHYYGELFPTAFYSKSVLEPYVSQGLVYLGLFLAKNWFLPGALFALVVLHRKARASDVVGVWDDRYLVACAALYAAYVVEVGGDFMFARRLVPVVPLLLAALEGAVCRLASPRIRLGLAAACLVGAALPLPLFHGAERIRGISDQRAFYPDEIVELRRRQGEAVGRALAGTEVRAVFEGGMCMFAYYSRLPYLVEMSGLTQYSVAKQPLRERGQPGHEKGVDAAWMTEHDIHLVFSQALPPVRPRPGPRRLDEVLFGNEVRARIHGYSDAVMDALRRRPDVHFTPIEEALEIHRRAMEQAPSAEAAQAIYDGLEDYYFRRSGAGGAARAAALRAVVERKRAAPAAPGTPRGT